MRERDAGSIHNGTSKNFQAYGRSNELILKPGIGKLFVVLDLIKMNGIEIFTLIVIKHDRTCPPWSAAPTVFILQTDEEQNIFHPAHRRYRHNELDRTITIAAVPPHKLTG